jgi:MGT family glycosyltransferase
MVRSRSVRGLASYQFLWEEVLVPLARSMRPGVARALEAYRPDLAIVDQQAIGGALAARSLGFKWATLCTTSADLVDALAGLPRVKAWANEQLVMLQRESGLEPAPAPDLSTLRVVVLSTPELVGPSRTFPAHYRFTGPALGDRPANPLASEFPWDQLQEMPRVLVSLGTVSVDREEPFYETAIEAFREQPMQMILAAPGRRFAPGSLPPNVIARPWVPQLELLKKVQAVVTHGGHNTVCEALSAGLPLVVTPIRDDQPVIANQVVGAGAGLRLRFGHLSPASLRAAVERVLHESGFRAGAERIKRSFEAAGGTAAAARALAEVA